MGTPNESGEWGPFCSRASPRGCDLSQSPVRGNRGAPLEGQYLHIFHRAVSEAAKKTRPEKLACPVHRPPYYQGGRPILSSVDKWSPKPIGFVLPLRQHLRCPSGASAVPGQDLV